MKIPLPIPTVGHVNSYLIRAEGRRLLIDTGMGGKRSFTELRRQMAEKGVRPQDLTEILVTHYHIDHVGLVPRLRRLSGAKLIVSAKGREALKLRTYESRLKKMAEFYEEAGTPEELVKQMLNPTQSYRAVFEELGEASRIVKDGDEVLIGGYSFQVLWTPGHSPGHICLYESKRRLLIAGDHILPNITPHITPYVTEGGEERDCLAEYLKSLDKIRKLDVDITLPGHGEIFTNHRKRIDELREHHRKRVEEILSELKRQASTAYEATSRIHWDVEYASWARFPVFQKLLALAETLAHLQFLEKQKKVKKSKEAGKTYYRPM